MTVMDPLKKPRIAELFAQMDTASFQQDSSPSSNDSAEEKPIRVIASMVAPEALPFPMQLHNEAGHTWVKPNKKTIEAVIRELNPGRSNSFACLSFSGGNFIQCLHGFNGWHLEWRITEPCGSYQHYRASNPGGSEKAMELKKHDFVSPGQHRDLMKVDDVVSAFWVFRQRKDLPSFLNWRTLDI